MTTGLHMALFCIHSSGTLHISSLSGGTSVEGPVAEGGAGWCDIVM